MSKPSCTVSRAITETIKINNEAATKAKKILDTIDSQFEAERRPLTDNLTIHRLANVALNHELSEHKTGCTECQKGD
jgi:hypothetical protein